MDRLEFNALLKKANLNKKQLAEILGTSYQSVNNWSANSRGYPYWVKSWLENYIKSKSYEDIKDKVLEIENLAKK